MSVPPSFWREARAHVEMNLGDEAIKSMISLCFSIDCAQYAFR